MWLAAVTTRSCRSFGCNAKTSEIRLALKQTHYFFPTIPCGGLECKPGTTEFVVQKSQLSWEGTCQLALQDKMDTSTRESLESLIPGMRFCTIFFSRMIHVIADN